MSKVAVIETKVSRNNFSDFGFNFDRYQLCSDPSVKKVLKRDVDIEINEEDYDWIILVGSEPCKYFAKVNSVMEYSGKKVDEKYIPIINPAMLSFKPEMRDTWTKSVENILKYLSGDYEDFVLSDEIARGISDTEEAKAYIKEAIKHPKPYVGLDSETTGLYPRDGYMLGLSLSYCADFGAYINTDCLDEECEALLQELFDLKTVVFHNAKFDIAFFEYHFGFKFPKFEDTMLLHYLINENPGTHGLKQLAMHYTKYGDYEKELHTFIKDYCKQHGIKASEFKWDYIPFDIMYPYAATDALVTFTLYEKFVKIKQNKKLAWVYDNILIPGCRFLTDIQDNGVPFDRKRLLTAQAMMSQDIEKAVETLYKNPKIVEFERFKANPFNPNSTVQLRSLLFDYLGLTPTKKTATGAASTDAEVLESLAEESEVPGLILEIRKKSKIKNTYLDKIIPQLDTDSRLRTGFNLHSTTSGRLSSSGKLNMQQLPRDNPLVKGCISARPGYVIVAMDLTTAEVYVASVLSDDQALQEVFRKGGDFHGAIAHRVFNLPCEIDEVKELYPIQRQAAKAVTFGIMYGAGAMKISEQVTKESGTYFSRQEAQEVIDEYFRTFHKLKSWIDNNTKFIETNGFIYSHFGRKRRLPNVFSDDKGIKGHSVRSGLNFLVQSTASDINLLGAIEAQDYIKKNKKDWRIFALVHDSILAEIPEAEAGEYSNVILNMVQKDRGVSIPGTPIGCDFDIGKDYSFGKFEKYVEEYAEAA